MNPKLAEFYRLKRYFLYKMLEDLLPNVNYDVSYVYNLSSWGRYIRGTSGERACDELIIGILTEKGTRLDKREVEKHFQISLEECAKRVNVKGDFQVIYSEGKKSIHIPKSRNTRLNAFLRAYGDAIKKRFLGKEQMPKNKSTSYEFKQSSRIGAPSSQTGYGNMQRLLRSTDSIEYKHYSELKGEYETILRELLKKKSITQKIGFGVLGSQVINNGDISILLDEEDDNSFNKESIETAFKTSLEECLSEILPNCTFRVKFNNDENAVYIRRPHKQNNPIESLAFLHAYKFILLENQ